MNTKKILKAIETAFEKRLQQKTGWGKNEVLQAYKECQNEALMNAIDESEVVKNEPEFKSGYTYYAYYAPLNEHWKILGIDVKGDRVCSAGWPPTIAKLSDCFNFHIGSLITKEELEYREKNFGTNWI